MRELVGAVLVLVVSFFPIVGKRIGRVSQPEESSVAKPLRRAISEIKTKTKIAVLLPSALPARWAKRALVASGQADNNGYRITLTARSNCNGDSCFVGLFEAKRGIGQPRPFEADKTVSLTKSIRGYYTKKSCGGSCTPPEIDWVSDGIGYSIQFKVNGKNNREDESSLIMMARSAIKGGPR